MIYSEFQSPADDCLDQARFRVLCNSEEYGFAPSFKLACDMVDELFTYHERVLELRIDLIVGTNPVHSWLWSFEYFPLDLATAVHINHCELEESYYGRSKNT